MTRRQEGREEKGLPLGLIEKGCRKGKPPSSQVGRARIPDSGRSGRPPATRGDGIGDVGPPSQARVRGLGALREGSRAPLHANCRSTLGAQAPAFPSRCGAPKTRLPWAARLPPLKTVHEHVSSFQDQDAPSRSTSMLPVPVLFFYGAHRSFVRT